ncbi:MAG: hypothetical protein QW587_02925 [Candidatus Bathyarchaeia archaeon]
MRLTPLRLKRPSRQTTAHRHDALMTKSAAGMLPCVGGICPHEAPEARRLAKIPAR